MRDDVREKMVLGALRLLATNGLEGVSFSTVLELTGTPRGSIYHHFPEGKNQLIGLAVVRAGQYLLEAMDLAPGTTPVAVAEHFLGIWRRVLVDSRCQAGCAVLAVTVAASDRVLLSQARDVFQSWQARLAEQLLQGGLSPDQAKAFAAMLIASVEGAVALSRAAQSPEVFDMTATMLLDQLKSLAAATSVSPSGSRRAAATRRPGISRSPAAQP
jgi:TetR/AcrR family transcriptional regulator, lmrAB and yxaGH operons repressor